MLRKTERRAERERALAEKISRWHRGNAKLGLFHGLPLISSEPAHPPSVRESADGESPMKFMIVFNDSNRQESSVNTISGESGEGRAHREIERLQKEGHNITFLIYDAIDRDAALAEAKRLKPHHHQVPDTLVDYH